MDDEYHRETRETLNSFVLLVATASFLAAHFRIGDAEVLFWLGVRVPSAGF